RSREVRPGSCVTFLKVKDQTWCQTDKFGDRLRTRRTKVPEAFQADRGTVETASAGLLRAADLHRAKYSNGRSKVTTKVNTKVNTKVTTKGNRANRRGKNAVKSS